jgi:hypothetical protein
MAVRKLYTNLTLRRVLRLRSHMQRNRMDLADFEVSTVGQ